MNEEERQLLEAQISHYERLIRRERSPLAAADLEDARDVLLARLREVTQPAAVREPSVRLNQPGSD